MIDQSNDVRKINEEKIVAAQLLGIKSTDQLVLNDSGWDSRIYSDPEYKYFIKFPRSEKIKQRYVHEIKALQLARTISPDILIPKICWQDPDNTYFGYEGIQGTLLSEAVTSMDVATKQSIGTQMGLFLKSFSSGIVDGAKEVEIEKEIAKYQEWYEPAKQTIAKHFTPAETVQLEKLVYTEWPQQFRSLGSHIVLSHGDFHFNNMILTGNHQLGIIDFGDVGYYDESKDFNGIDDAVIFEAALKSYGDNMLLRQKIDLRQKAFIIIRLTAAIGKGQEEAQEKVIDALRIQSMLR